MKYYLAPMEGLTTYHFRRTWNHYYGGMDKYFTPFISNRNMSSREKKDVLPEHNRGMNTVPQILTNKAEEFLELSGQLAQYGYREVNLNLGCPSGTVVARNRGAGFLGVRSELDAFLGEIFEKCPVAISIKTRIGMKSMDEWPGLLDIYKKYPISELTIHPRLQVEGYKGLPHWEAYEVAASVLSCSMCYNGDINSPEDLDRLMQRLPMVDTVMLGRGILRNPGLLQLIKGEQSKNPAAEIREFHDALLEGYTDIMSGDTNTLFKMKDLWAFLALSFASPEKYVKRIKKAGNMSEYRIAVNTLFRECPLRQEACRL